MKRIATLVAIILVLVGCGAVAKAQQPKKVPRIGYLSQYDAAAESARFEPFRRLCASLAILKGKTSPSSSEVGRESPIDSLRLRPSWCVSRLISSSYPPESRIFRRPRMRPRRFPSLCWPFRRILLRQVWLKALLVPAATSPALQPFLRELGGKRLELLKEAFTKVARVAVLYEPAVRPSQIEVKEILPVAARCAGLTIQPWEVRGVDDFDRVFVTMGKQRSDGLYVTTGPLMSTNQKRIADFALKSRLPSVYGIREAVDAGGLMYYGADLADSYRRAAIYVDRILKGAKPGDLPVEQPTKFELVINLKTAKQIGVTIPQSLLYRVDKVIK